MLRFFQEGIMTAGILVLFVCGLLVGKRCFNEMMHETFNDCKPITHKPSKT